MTTSTNNINTRMQAFEYIINDKKLDINTKLEINKLLERGTLEEIKERITNNNITIEEYSEEIEILESIPMNGMGEELTTEEERELSTLIDKKDHLILENKILSNIKK